MKKQCLIQLDEDLYTEFKTLVTDQYGDRSMSYVIRNLMSDYIAQNTQEV